MAPILWSINTLAPSWWILYPKVLELSLRLVGFLVSLCPYAYLRVIPQRFFNSIWIRVSNDYWRVTQCLCSGPPASHLPDRHPLLLCSFGHRLLLPGHHLQGILGILTKPLAAGPLCWGGSNSIGMSDLSKVEGMAWGALLSSFKFYAPSFHDSTTILTYSPDPFFLQHTLMGREKIARRVLRPDGQQGKLR